MIRVEDAEDDGTVKGVMIYDVLEKFVSGKLGANDIDVDVSVLPLLSVLVVVDPFLLSPSINKYSDYLHLHYYFIKVISIIQALSLDKALF